MSEAPGRAAEMSAPRGSALAFASALALTVLMAAPVALAPSERLFGATSTLGRDDPNRDPLVVIDQFRSGRVASPYLQPLTDLPGRWLAALVGPVASYNLLTLATFPLSAAAGYLLARHVSGGHLAAMVAGLAYAFLPFHVMQAAGHPHVAQTQWLPLYLLALWRCIERPTPGRAALLVSAAAAVTLSNFYGGWIAAVLSPAALVGYGWISGPRASRGRRMALSATVLAATALGALLLMAWLLPAVLVPGEGRASFARADLFAWSARWWSLLVPPVEHPILGPAVREFWKRHGVTEALLEHQQVALGWAPLLLAAVPLGLWLRGERAPAGVRHAPALALLGFAAVLCALSPERTLGELTMVRPSALLYEIAPMFRAYARFAVVAGLTMALLAGAGAEWLSRSGARGRACAALLLGLTAFEYWPGPPWRWRDVLPTQAHRWLAAQRGPLRVLDCVPPVRYTDLLALPLLGHPASLLGPDSAEDCAEPGLVDKLRAAEYTHVVVREASTARAWFDIAGWPAGLARGPRFPDAAVLRVRPGVAAVHVAELHGFLPREYAGTATWRWMSQAGALELLVPRDVAELVVDLELRAFPQTRRVSWFLDRAPGGLLEVGPSWQRHLLRLGPLAGGRVTIQLLSHEAPVVADRVLHNGDPRALGVALGRWSFESLL